MNSNTLLSALAILLLQVVWMGGVSANSSLRLRLPVDCDIGSVCHVQNLFDHDAGGGFGDYRCGHLGYDGHDGTDIRVSNLAVMHRGVAVVAAAAGRVRAIRDEMPDVSVRDIGRDAVRGREAGNAVVLRHGRDWETQYSHLLRGSVKVRPGDEVQAGEVLGLIGLSGNTEFPHVHFEVRYAGDPVDPFVGIDGGKGCGPGAQPLWNAEALDALRYRPTGLLQAGFSDEVPVSRSVLSGEAGKSRFAAGAEALVFWVEVFGARKGDTELIRLTGPDRNVIAAKKSVVEGNKARWLSFAGRKRRGSAWPEGAYRGSYRLLREIAGAEQIVVDIEQSAQVR
jgi:hypothetical protein